MKRSQVLEIIKDNIESKNPNTWAHGELDLSESAEAILTAIEKAGMKPPLEENCPVLFNTKHVWGKEND